MGSFSCGVRTLSCGMHVGSGSPSRDRTWAPCIGSAESYLLDHQGSPSMCLYALWSLVENCTLEKITYSPSLCTLTVYGGKPSLMSPTWRCNIFSGLFWAYVFPGHVLFLFSFLLVYLLLISLRESHLLLLWALYVLLYSSAHNLLPPSVHMTSVPLWFSHAATPATTFHGFQPETQDIPPFLADLQVKTVLKPVPKATIDRLEHIRHSTYFLPPGGGKLRIGPFHPNHTGEGVEQGQANMPQNLLLFLVWVFLDWVFSWLLRIFDWFPEFPQSHFSQSLFVYIIFPWGNKGLELHSLTSSSWTLWMP